MTNVIVKKIVAAALIASTLPSGTTVATTGAALTAVTAVSVLSAAPADAATCKDVTIEKMASSAGAFAGLRKRRATRKAVRAWENEVAAKHGSDLADFDDAKNTNLILGTTDRGNTSIKAVGTITICI